MQIWEAWCHSGEHCCLTESEIGVWSWFFTSGVWIVFRCLCVSPWGSLVFLPQPKDLFKSDCVEIAYLCFVMRWSGKLSVMFLCHLPVHVHTHSPSWLGIIRISCRGTELKIQIIQNCLSVWFHERQSFQKRLLYTSLTPLTAAVSQWCQC